MKICVAGLGLIGGSMCMALKRAGYRVDGYNRSKDPLEYALKNNVIDGAAVGFEEYDVVFVALPPKPTVDFILHTPFKKGAVVADICGVKKYIQDAVCGVRTDINYVGTHPMAGKEVSGVQNACADLFDRASMVITRGICADERSFNVIKGLVKDMGFARIVECSAELHDRKIAYTSQLAHVVSNCYVNDPEIDGCLGFTGGSFQDMTRIAGVDENVWAELYLNNADNLLASATNLADSLGKFISALKEAKRSGDSGAVRRNLSVGANAYRNGKANNFTGDGISVTELKKGGHMKYGLKIIQTSGGVSSTVAVDAEARVLNGALILTYSYDGARYTLNLSEGKIGHRRMGETCLDMTFIKGVRTYCTLREGNLNGGFYVTTEKLEVLNQSDGVKAELCYAFDDGALTQLDITARAIP